MHTCKLVEDIAPHIKEWMANNPDAKSPWVANAVYEFFNNYQDCSPQAEHVVFGLTVTDTTNKEYWERLFSDSKEGAEARVQVQAMGEVIDCFLNETQMYPVVMKEYYGVVDREESSESV